MFVFGYVDNVAEDYSLNLPKLHLRKYWQMENVFKNTMKAYFSKRHTLF